MTENQAKSSKYKAEQIKVLEGLEGVRRRFDVIELSNTSKSIMIYKIGVSKNGN